MEGLNYPLVAAGSDEAEAEQPSSLLTLAAAGEAAVNGVFLQAVCDSAPLQDDYGYYISDGVYGAFNVSLCLPTWNGFKGSPNSKHPSSFAEHYVRSCFCPPPSSARNREGHI